MTNYSEIESVLKSDLSQGYLDAIEGEMKMVYDHSFEEIVSPARGFVSKRSTGFDQIDLLKLKEQRRLNGMKALASASKMCGVPFETKRLLCNGQAVVIAQCGRMLLMSEPIQHTSSAPVSADYKREMAGSHFAVRQLEFDLGDGFRSCIDSRDTILAIVLHGFHGNALTRNDTTMSMLQLAVPNAEFDSWLWRANMRNDEVALRLDWSNVEKPWKPEQVDRVLPSLKTIHLRGSK